MCRMWNSSKELLLLLEFQEGIGNIEGKKKKLELGLKNRKEKKRNKNKLSWSKMKILNLQKNYQFVNLLVE